MPRLDKTGLYALIDARIESGNRDTTAADVREVLDAIVENMQIEGGIPIPPGVYTSHLGISPDTDFTEAEFTISDDTPVLVLPANSWAAGERRYLAYLKPADRGVFSHVYYYPPGNRSTINRLGTSWLAQAGVIAIAGIDYNWVRTRVAFAAPSSARAVEAA